MSQGVGRGTRAVCGQGGLAKAPAGGTRQLRVSQCAAALGQRPRLELVTQGIQFGLQGVVDVLGDLKQHFYG
jgi:hypothetical protein